MNKSFNINNYATVTLTELGAKVYNSYYDGPRNYGWFVPLDSGETLREQVWSLFQIFGKHMGLGMENPFEGCIMTFDTEDFEE